MAVCSHNCLRQVECSRPKLDQTRPHSPRSVRVQSRHAQFGPHLDSSIRPPRCSSHSHPPLCSSHSQPLAQQLSASEPTLLQEDQLELCGSVLAGPWLAAGEFWGSPWVVLPCTVPPPTAAAAAGFAIPVFAEACLANQSRCACSLVGTQCVVGYPPA